MARAISPASVAGARLSPASSRADAMQLSGAASSNKERPDNLAERIYLQLKDDIFEFRLLPGDRFSEGEIAERVAASRTPVRQALYRLQREGYLQVYFRSGWQVMPFDFAHFEELYDVRIVLELEAVRRLCERPQDEHSDALVQLQRTWMSDFTASCGKLPATARWPACTPR